MASEEESTSDSLDTTKTDIPDNLLGYVRDQIVDTFKQSKFSAEIHHTQGSSPKLVVSCGNQPSKIITQALDSADSKTTCTIIVVNLPTTADEDLLEVFFESKKKYGGGPVKDVKIERDKNRAYVTFCEVSAVETVMKKKPIMLGTTELSVKPYTPLLSGSEAIGRIDVIGLPVSKDFTEGLLKRYSDPHPSPISTHRQPPTPTYGHRQPTTPTYGPELAALIKVGTRVVRGKDWKWGNDDGGGKGTITDLKALGLPGCFQVQWDAGLEGIYRMGAQGSYELQLAPES